ncbi:MAG: hypothetical protein Q8N07_10360 [Rhodocyclaceae bacterium]|nr:hypothetical protein [Rhodocyclaceae bacterium]
MTPPPYHAACRLAPSRQRRLLLAVILPALLAGCTSNPAAVDATGVGGKTSEAVAKVTTSVIGGPLIPDVALALGPSVSYPLEKLVYWGLHVGAAWLILDPLAPNWDIQEARFPENHVHFSMKMKRFYAGGAGEARVIFHRRAKEMMRAGGFGNYEVVEYSEGMASSVLGSQRTAAGVVRFI